MRQTILLSPDPWQPVPTRTQHLAARFRDTQILFFEPYPGSGAGKEGRRVRPHITVYTLPPAPIPLERAGFLPLLHRQGRQLASFISRVARKHGFRDPLLWTTCPDQVHLLEFLSFRGLVYDCFADYSDLPPQWEGELASQADVVFAASPGLSYRLSPCNANIVLLPNGANYAMFSRPAHDIPPELREVRGPVLGWVGDLNAGLDLSPVEFAARAHPEWTFLLLGRAEESSRLARLRTLGNVYLPGFRPMSELPDYAARFDLCLDLRRREQDFSDVIPRRIFEYLSTGKPIVTLLAPGQVEEFPDVIYGAHSPAEYCALCERALTEDKNWVSRRRRDYGSAASWSSRAEEVRRILSAISLA